MSEFRDPSLKSGIGTTCKKCKKKKPKRSSYNRSNVLRQSSSQVNISQKLCRKCDVPLRVGSNWTQSKKKKYDYICNTCNKSSYGSKSRRSTNSRDSSVPNCPRCSQKMVVRTNRQNGSEFWGCSNFPKCRGTLPKG